MRPIAATLALLSTLAVAPCASAQSVTVGGVAFDFADETLRPSAPEEKAFVASYLSAVTSGSVEAVAALVHPASLACAKSDTAREFLRDIHGRDAAHSIPPSARFIVVKTAEALSLGAAVTAMTTLPIQPTAYLGIDFTQEERDEKGTLVRSKGTTVLRMLAPHADRLAIVEYCLSQQGEQRFRELRAARRSEPTK